MVSAKRLHELYINTSSGKRCEGALVFAKLMYTIIL